MRYTACRQGARSELLLGLECGGSGGRGGAAVLRSTGLQLPRDAARVP